MLLKSSLSAPRSCSCGNATQFPAAAPRSNRDPALARSARAALLSAAAAAGSSPAHRSVDRSISRLVSCSVSATRTPSPQTDAASTLSRGIVYTTHEGNSWEATLAPSGACFFFQSISREFRFRSPWQVFCTNLFPFLPPHPKKKKTGTTILVDPWLVGALTFGDTPWLYEGKKKRLPAQDLAAVCSRTDVLLISQALPDHAHGPTLRALPDKALPVVCSPAAEAAVREAGFTDVTALPIGASAETAGGRLRVTATAGALVGPPWATRENGFLIEELGTTATRPLRIYYEPHCDWGEGALDALAGGGEGGAIDAVVTPAVSQRLAGYPLVMGEENLVRLVRALRPAALIPLVNAEFEQSGPLAAAIQQVGDGGAAAVEARLRESGLASTTKYYAPEAPGRPLAIEIA